MTVADLAYEVLIEADRALHYREITDLLHEKGLWRSTGKTPWDTVQAQIAVEIKKKGAASRFVRVSPGFFEANKLPQEYNDSKQEASVDLETEFESNRLEPRERLAWLEGAYEHLATKAELAEFRAELRAEMREFKQIVENAVGPLG